MTQSANGQVIDETVQLDARIRKLEAALDWALDHTKGPETEPTELSEILNASRSRLLGAALETEGKHG